MSILMEFSIHPTDKGESLSPYVARCVQIIEASGLPYKIGPMSTSIESEDIDELLDVIRQCMDDLQQDCRRIEADIRLDYRSKAGPRLEEPVASVEEKVGHKLKT